MKTYQSKTSTKQQKSQTFNEEYQKAMAEYDLLVPEDFGLWDEADGMDDLAIDNGLALGFYQVRRDS